MSGQLRAPAVNNFGIEGVERTFRLKSYESVNADHGGPYNGRPSQPGTPYPVKLSGSVNTFNYPGATFAYQWRVNDGVNFIHLPQKVGDPTAEYEWSADGDYSVEFIATITTAEGLVLTGSATTTVHIESGVPTAMPGGPYRGGIAGGNFSPIQFAGNPPDFIEAADIGRIVDWQWFFVGRTISTERSLQFNGVDEYVEVNPHPSLDLTTDWTLSAWINRAASGGRQDPIVEKYDWAPGFGGYAMRVEWDNRLTVYLINSQHAEWVTGNTVISANQWYHVVATYKFSDNVGELKVYVNGQLDGRAFFNPPQNSTVPLKIGARGDDADTKFYGLIDDVSVWSGALTDSEILNVMNKGLVGNENGLAGYWPFDEGAGLTASDKTAMRSCLRAQIHRPGRISALRKQMKRGFTASHTCPSAVSGGRGGADRGYCPRV